MHVSRSAIWPKVRKELTVDQQAIMEDWYSEFLGKILPEKFGWVDKVNHSYALRSAATGLRTLEIGPGNGSHIAREDLSEQREYVVLELRESLSAQIGAKYPNLRVVVGDCQSRLEFEDDAFDRVLAIHVLEHLENLPAALREISRVMRKFARFSVVIPCEGGWAYSLGRRLTIQRTFEKRYKMPYDWMIRYEHINKAQEVVDELKKVFRVVDRKFYPIGLPSVNLNVVMGMTLSLPD
jgi:SAM-dependent methyltransferase